MALYVCKCGYPIWAESMWNGLEYVPEYSDNWENSPTFGQVITSCPQCGEGLDRFHQWWTARADTTDGYLELWESGVIRIRDCPDCAEASERYGLLPSVCAGCGADRTISPDWAIDLFCEMSLTGGNESPYPLD